MPTLHTFADLKHFVPRHAYDVAERLSGLVAEGDIDAWAQSVIDCFPKGGFDLFQEIDEYPGRFNYVGDKFWMLRRVRNHPDWGKRLFAHLREARDD